MIKKIILASALAISFSALAEQVPITGSITPKCVVHTDVPGVYGNPSPSVLSTATADGGVQPIIRYDVIESGYYKAVITTPSAFSSSPALPDFVTWTGSTAVSKVTDAAMSAYTTNKKVYNNTSEFSLTVPGTVWFATSSKAQYGYDKAFPAGDYRAVVLAECIAL